jgi:hypothetical protein
VLRDLDLTPNQVWGLTKTDHEWSAALEAALTANPPRRPGARHQRRVYGRLRVQRVSDPPAAPNGQESPGSALALMPLLLFGFLLEEL